MVINIMERTDFKRKMDRLQRAKLTDGVAQSFIDDYMDTYNMEYNEHYAKYMAFSNISYALEMSGSLKLAKKFAELARSEHKIADLIYVNQTNGNSIMRNIVLGNEKRRVEKNKITERVHKIGNAFQNSVEKNLVVDQLKTREDFGVRGISLINGLNVYDLAVISPQALVKVFETYPLIAENINRTLKGKNLKQPAKIEKQQIKYPEKEYENGSTAKDNETVIEQDLSLAKKQFFEDYILPDKSDYTGKHTKKSIITMRDGTPGVNRAALEVMVKLDDEQFKSLYDAQMRNVSDSGDKAKKVVQTVITNTIYTKYALEAGKDINKENTSIDKEQILKAIEIVVLKKEIDNPKFYIYEEMLNELKTPVKKSGNIFANH